MLRETVKGALIASAVAALFASNPVLAQGKAKPKQAAKAAVHCQGVNECKGKGACAGAENACKGQNDCKGKSYIETKSAKDCTDKGGTVIAAKKK